MQRGFGAEPPGALHCHPYHPSISEMYETIKCRKNLKENTKLPLQHGLMAHCRRQHDRGNALRNSSAAIL